MMKPEKQRGMTLDDVAKFVPDYFQHITLVNFWIFQTEYQLF